MLILIDNDCALCGETVYSDPDGRELLNWGKHFKEKHYEIYTLTLLSEQLSWQWRGHLLNFSPGSADGGHWERV